MLKTILRKRGDTNKSSKKMIRITIIRRLWTRWIDRVSNGSALTV